MSDPVYFEYLSFSSCLHSLIKNYLSGNKVFYIDINKNSKRLLVPFLEAFGFKVEQLKFQMRNVKDVNNELLSERIPRQDLFEFQSEVLQSLSYQELRHESWFQDRVISFINKGIVDGDVQVPSSPHRLLFYIQVVNSHMQQIHCSSSTLIANKRPWFDVYKNYAANYGINLEETYKPFSQVFNTLELNAFIRRFPKLYILFKNIKYKKKETSKLNDLPKLFVDGRGNINFENNGYHSDFFWLLNSDFPVKNVLCQHHSESEKKSLLEYGINATGGSTMNNNGNEVKIKKIHISNASNNPQEAKKIKSILASYGATRTFWSVFFKTHNVKVNMTWHRFDNHHMGVADAIKDVGGISVYWPLSFDGHRQIGCNSDIDVAFCFSQYSADLEKQTNSKSNYNVITGYPRDYSGQLLRKEAKELREKLLANGAKKIIFAIDENSIDDSRWHTGHELQRENYSYILQKVLEIPWLGAVFKPKIAKTLRKRLGHVADLLEKSEKTGRCFVYESSGRYSTNAPPILAGLSADICIHGHLSAGTAALECALEGLPTLLIDREGTPFSKLYDLPEGKVIFKDWPSAIEATLEHFNTPKGIVGFGDWSSIIDDLDPFRDGKAAYRMGSYLHWLIEGFENNLDREIIMANAAKRYKAQWREDKVITS